VEPTEEVTMPEPDATQPQPDPTLSYEPPSSPTGPAASAPPPAPWYGAPGHYRDPAAAVSSQERNWAVAAHLSGFAAAYVALGFLGPLVVLLAAGHRSPFIRRHATEALNFNLTVLIALVISVVLIIVLIGIPMLLVVGLGYLVTTIAGAIAASRGEDYRYPLTIRFVR
jgi:uncharacterized Tic20 family protein